MLKYIFHFFVAFILTMIQQSFITGLADFSSLNILLVFLIFVTIVWGFNLGFIYAIYIGILINIYSFLPIGTYVVIYMLLIIIIDYLYKNLLINFSLITNLLLTILATLIYSLLSVFAAYFFYYLNVINIYIDFDKQYFDALWSQLILNIILMCIIYLAAKSTIKKFNLAFLIKK